MRRILHGVKVLDLTHVIAGPYASFQLGLLGANVIKVENPSNPDIARYMGVGCNHGMGTLFRAQSAGKRSVTLDLRLPGDRSQLLSLLEDADVLIENYRVGALSKFNLGYEDLKETFPKLIYCSLTGFGQTGPKASQNAYDNVIQATSGLMSLNGDHRSWPLKVGAPIIDYATGLMAAFATMAALYDREKTDQGQHIDVSMLETALSLMSVNVLGLSETKGRIERPDSRAQGHPGLSVYKTANGEIMLGAMTERQLSRLLTFLEKPEVRVSSKNSEEIFAKTDIQLFLESKFPEKSADYWERELNEKGIPAQKVRTLHEAINDPHSQERNGFIQSGDGFIPNTGFRFSNAHVAPTCPAPHIGQHNEELLRKLPKRYLTTVQTKENLDVLSL